MSKQIEKIVPEYFNRHCLTSTEGSATVVHAMGGSMMVAKINELVDAITQLQMQVSDDEVIVNGKRYKAVK